MIVIILVIGIPVYLFFVGMHLNKIDEELREIRKKLDNR